jgi:hypothetical protein
MFLQDKLSKLGMEFYSPGGTIEGRASWLLGGYLKGSCDSPFLRNTTVRVQLDTIASVVEANFHVENKAE